MNSETTLFDKEPILINCSCWDLHHLIIVKIELEGEEESYLRWFFQRVSSDNTFEKSEFKFFDSILFKLKENASGEEKDLYNNLFWYVWKKLFSEDEKSYLLFELDKDWDIDISLFVKYQVYEDNEYYMEQYQLKY